MQSLRQRIELQEMSREWLNAMATRYHYMHRPIHQRACPFGWAVTFNDSPLGVDGKFLAKKGSLYQPDGLPSGFIIFASIHFTRLEEEFGYPELPTKWQVLSLSRLWLHDDLPCNSETCVIGKALKLVQRRWLEVHPPRFLDEPYHILKVISYADARYHSGAIYRAANFRPSGETVSAPRHRNTRGSGMDGATLIRFIYDLKKPNWEWKPKAVQMELEI